MKEVYGRSQHAWYGLESAWFILAVDVTIYGLYGSSKASIGATAGSVRVIRQAAYMDPWTPCSGHLEFRDLDSFRTVVVTHASVCRL